MLFGGIEGGGTKFVCAVATETGEIIARARFPTADPKDTVTHAADVFKQFETQ
ncbi:MAG: ROK family protein, partial [Anaerolineae bacterium]|nr:ROK family protein [Anaerolineae bacterium]